MEPAALASVIVMTDWRGSTIHEFLRNTLDHHAASRCTLYKTAAARAARCGLGKWCEMEDPVWKVGEIARRTGVSVRTLHHYDEIGLLTPSARSDTGYRLYVREDLLRLQQIMSLQQLGFTLAEIREMLNGDACPAGEVITLHAERVSEQIDVLQQLRRRLLALRDRLRIEENTDTDELLSLIQEIEMTEKFEKYYTPEQRDYLKQRREELGEERIREAEREWPALIKAVRSEMSRGTPPTHPRVRRLARRWRSLIEEFTGGDAGILQSLRNMYRQEPDIAAAKGYTPEPAMSSFVSKALAADVEVDEAGSADADR